MDVRCGGRPMVNWRRAAGERYEWKKLVEEAKVLHDIEERRKEMR